MGNDKEIEQYVAGNFKEVTVDNGQDAFQTALAVY
jgi:hypothetical protein